ncbi:MAG: Ryanodine receptor Ryr [Proteobacteria bacterium]|nr:Ryanodine receptor Ryr [Pseudomonadota bacterium]
MKNIIEENIKKLAETEHIRWQENREANGWTYAKVRNDYKKTHNCLISYTDLPEKEKEKDRNTIRKYKDFLKKTDFRIVIKR